MVPEVGLEPTRVSSKVFETSASANSATRAAPRSLYHDFAYTYDAIDVRIGITCLKHDLLWAHDLSDLFEKAVLGIVEHVYYDKMAVVHDHVVVR